eukprot:scaffold7387_cov408-Prasinococcus_capsulatus_cf.AAC.25
MLKVTPIARASCPITSPARARATAEFGLGRLGCHLPVGVSNSSRQRCRRAPCRRASGCGRLHRSGPGGAVASGSRVPLETSLPVGLTAWRCSRGKERTATSEGC